MADGLRARIGQARQRNAAMIGALNLAAGLRDAWLAHSPVIALTGARCDQVPQESPGGSTTCRRSNR